MADGAVDERALALALDEIRRRHEILRTPFSACAASIRCRWSRCRMQPSLRRSTLPRMPTSERTSEAMRLATEEAGQPFDLGTVRCFAPSLFD